MDSFPGVVRQADNGGRPISCQGTRNSIRKRHYAARLLHFLKKASRDFNRRSDSAMNIGRQSMYDTFGDKRALFLKALERYSQENVNAIVAELLKPGSPLANIRNVLILFTERKDFSPRDGCMGINAICEFGLTDQEVLEAMQEAAALLRHDLLATLKRAKKEGELSADTDIAVLADFIDVTLGRPQGRGEGWNESRCNET